jgi:hypothetical protein
MKEPIQDRCSPEFQRRAKDLLAPSVILNVSYIIDGFRPFADSINECPISEEEFCELTFIQDFQDAAEDSDYIWFNSAEDVWVDATPEDYDPSIDTIEEYDSVEEACEARGIEPYEHEVLEYWHVDGWLAQRLEAQGERVVHLNELNLVVWCRTTSGQSLFMDSCMEQITIDEVYSN